MSHLVRAWCDRSVVSSQGGGQLSTRLRPRCTPRLSGRGSGPMTRRPLRRERRACGERVRLEVCCSTTLIRIPAGRHGQHSPHSWLGGLAVVRHRSRRASAYRIWQRAGGSMRRGQRCGASPPRIQVVCGGCRSAPNRRRGAHRSSVVVHYPWHPLGGHELEVAGRHVRGGEASCVVVLPDGTRTEVPEWMTKVDARDGAELVASATVPVSALQALRRLVDAVMSSGEPPADPIDGRASSPVPGDLP